MTKVKVRAELEKLTDIDRAKLIVQSFHSSYEAYSLKDFLMRKGLIKDLAEEFVPLYELAISLENSSQIKLLPDGNKGPDGEISFNNGKKLSVQITCADEGYQKALLREQLSEDGIVATNQHRIRDEKTGKVVGKGPASSSLDALVMDRVERILDAIKKKNRKFYAGTDILLVQDEPADTSIINVENIHKKVSEYVRELGTSPYPEIYILYGQVLKKVC